MRCVTRKRWLAPLAVCLAVSLAMHPIGLGIAQAEETEETVSAVDAFWQAVEAFWDVESSFWQTCDLEWGNEEADPPVLEASAVRNVYEAALDAYYIARDDGGDVDSARAALQEAGTAVREFIAAYKSAYAEVETGYNAVLAKYDMLSEEEKTAQDEEGGSAEATKTEITKIWQGDGTEGNEGIAAFYEQKCLELAEWSYWDNETRYWDADMSYGAAAEALWGNEEAGIAGAVPEYDTAKEAGESDLAALRQAALEAISNMENAYANIGKAYASVVEAYNALSVKTEEIESNYADITESKSGKDADFQEMQLNLWKYYDSNEDYWTAQIAFWDAVTVLNGNEDEGGVFAAYEAALEEKAEGLDALYAEVLEARSAALAAYPAEKEQYEALSAIYAALTEEEKETGEPLTVADIHADIVGAHTDVETEYNRINELEIPEPPQEEEPAATPTPTPVPTATPGQTTATPTPVPTTTPGQTTATPTPVPTTTPGQTTATPTPVPTVTPQKPAATSAPASTTTSKQETAAKPASKQEAATDWNAVYNSVEKSVATGEAQNVYTQSGASFQVNSNILDKLAGSKTALFLNTGTGLSFSVSGVDVYPGAAPLKVSLAGTDGIPEAAKQSVVTGAAFSRAFAMEDKSVYPVKIDVHLNVGKENAGKTAYLYYYDEITGSMKLAGGFMVTETGQAMFAINHGDEYIVVVADSVAGVSGHYTVVAGDNLSRIASKNGISLKQLLQANPGIKNPNRIHPGDVINLN